ncbi:MAG: ribonuclease P protein component [Armatimonadetes bacterium]|nr:ribonuclease P protein component [Armatimonadota bacterium]
MNGPSRQRFDELFSQGQRAVGRLFRVCSLPGEGLVGFATARAIGCHARRNRAKRRARAAFNALPPLSVRADMAVLVREEAAKAEWNELVEELGRLCEETQRRWAADSGS